MLPRLTVSLTTVDGLGDAGNYEPKGTYETIEGYKTYVTGSKESDKALLCVYDIFGFHPATQQGADLLASEGYYVIMPDLLHGEIWPLEKYPPRNEAEEKEIDDFFETTARIEVHVPAVQKIAEYFRRQNFAKLGIYGFCWGGKITVLSCREGTLFSAAALVHPSMLEPEDASYLQVPVAIYPSDEEDHEKEIAPFLTAVEKNHRPRVAEKTVHKSYAHMHHGFAAARANLEDETNRREFEDVYGQLAGFFEENVC